MKTRVYYADTDAGGVVYHANYLRWLEMARCEFMRHLGLSVADYAKQGCLFTVVRIEIDYHLPAVLDDEIQVETVVCRVRRVRFLVKQRVVRTRDGSQLATAIVAVACVDPRGKVLALPKELALALRGCLAPVVRSLPEDG